MTYQLAQLNIARFMLPEDHPANRDFVDNLDRVNAIAENQPGFVWRYMNGDRADEIDVFEDPNIAVNMSVWTDMGALANFAYRNKDHTEIMRRRREWFEKIEFYLVLWWISEGHVPSLLEAKDRLNSLSRLGPTPAGFTFKQPFPASDGESIDPILDECA